MNRSIVLIVFSLFLFGYLAYIQLTEGKIDPRQSIESGIEFAKESAKIDRDQEDLLRLQLALADYTASNGKPPSSLDSLVPTYFDSVPKNPVTGVAFKYVKNGPGYSLGSSAKDDEEMSPAELLAKAGLGGGFVNPNDMELIHFTYDPTNRRDPFRPFNSETGEVDLSLPPLQRYEIGQLKVTAILADITGSGGRTAIVEDATGRGYPVKKGVKIGNRKGVVVAIDEDKVHVLEIIKDFTGKEKKFPRTLKFNKKDRKDGNIRENIRRNYR